VYAWARGLAERLAAVEARSASNEIRLNAAETRTEAAEERAERAENLYTVAITYLRAVAAWINSRWPDETMPTPPPELKGEL
jgi:hypothetical protein